jgi:nucleotide-binding universal stress UspA family protein
MQKILVGINGLDLNLESIEFACYLTRLTNSKLTAIFLENLVENERLVLTAAYGTTYPDWQVNPEAPAYKEKVMKIQENIKLFKEFCESKAVRYDIHRDFGIPRNEMINETRFADLLVLPANISFTKEIQAAPSDFIKDVLADAECPVVVVPDKFEGINEIVFTYDGSRSSAFAIRQFSNLFPHLSNKKVTVLQINKKGEIPLDEKNNIREWLGYHFLTVEFDTLTGEPEDLLLTYLLSKRNVFIVMGAFGRNALSMYFRHSHAESIIERVTQPVFIAHC